METLEFQYKEEINLSHQQTFLKNFIMNDYAKVIKKKKLNRLFILASCIAWIAFLLALISFFKNRSYFIPNCIFVLWAWVCYAGALYFLNRRFQSSLLKVWKIAENKVPFKKDTVLYRFCEETIESKSDEQSTSKSYSSIPHVYETEEIVFLEGYTWLVKKFLDPSIEKQLRDVLKQKLNDRYVDLRVPKRRPFYLRPVFSIASTFILFLIGILVFLNPGQNGRIVERLPNNPSSTLQEVEGKLYFAATPDNTGGLLRLDNQKTSDTPVQDVSSMTSYKNLLYWISSQKILSCYDTKTGSVTTLRNLKKDYPNQGQNTVIDLFGADGTGAYVTTHNIAPNANVDRAEDGNTIARISGDGKNFTFLRRVAYDFLYSHCLLENGAIYFDESDGKTNHGLYSLNLSDNQVKKLSNREPTGFNDNYKNYFFWNGRVIYLSSDPADNSQDLYLCSVKTDGTDEKIYCKAPSTYCTLVGDSVFSWDLAKKGLAGFDLKTESEFIPKVSGSLHSAPISAFKNQLVVLYYHPEKPTIELYDPQSGQVKTVLE